MDIIWSSSNQYGKEDGDDENREETGKEGLSKNRKEEVEAMTACKRGVQGIKKFDWNHSSVWYYFLYNDKIGV